MECNHELDIEQRDVTASEIGCYVYCAKAWHLQHVILVEASSDTRLRRETGITEHARHGRRVAVVGTLGRYQGSLTVALVLVAAIALVGAVLVR